MTNKTTTKNVVSMAAPVKTKSEQAVAKENPKNAPKLQSGKQDASIQSSEKTKHKVGVQSTAQTKKPDAKAKKTNVSTTGGVKPKAVQRKVSSVKPKSASLSKSKKSVSKSTEKKVLQKTKPALRTSNILQYQIMENTMKNTTQQFDAYTKEAVDFARQNMDAAKKSGEIFVNGFEGIMKASMEMMRSAAEKQASYVQDSMSSKTVNEFTDIQGKLMQSSFDDFMEGVTKISEMTVKTLSDASEPMNEQLNKAVNSVNKAA